MITTKCCKYVFFDDKGRCNGNYKCIDKYIVIDGKGRAWKLHSTGDGVS